MAPNRASSPTSLLWAHQLKREHRSLSDRLLKIETKATDYDTHFKTSERLSKTASSLAERVKHLEQANASRDASDTKNNISGRLSALEAEHEKTANAVLALQRQVRVTERDRRSYAGERTAMLHRIRAIEANFEKCGRQLRKLESSQMHVQLEEVKGQLCDLISQLQSGDDRMHARSQPPRKKMRSALDDFPSQLTVAPVSQVCTRSRFNRAKENLPPVTPLPKTVHTAPQEERRVIAQEYDLGAIWGIMND